MLIILGYKQVVQQKLTISQHRNSSKNHQKKAKMRIQSYLEYLQ
jgi:hypothetical protein